jgi:hypothetical protein
MSESAPASVAARSQNPGVSALKRNPNRARRTQQTLRVWSWSQAQKAVPFIASIVRSLRESGLEALAHHRTLRRLTERPGRPDRAALIAQQEAENAAHQAEDQFAQAAEELQALDIFSLDPLQGQALVPFVHDEQLAWYIFDLFDSQPFRFWRFQSDPDETRRQLTASQKT